MRFLDVGDLVDFIASRLTKYPELEDIEVELDEELSAVRVLVMNDSDAIVTWTKGRVSKQSLHRSLTVKFGLKKTRVGA